MTIWPDEAEAQAPLHGAAQQALKQGQGLICSQQPYGPNRQRTCDMVAAPLLVDGRATAVFGLMVTTRSEPQLQAVLQLMQWGGIWLENLVKQATRSENEASVFTRDLMLRLLSHKGGHTAAMEIANQLADRLGCERVSIGFRHGLPIKLQVMSHLASFDPRTQLARHLEAAMEEAVDQSATLVYPRPQTQTALIGRAQRELAMQSGNSATCTLPLPGNDELIGAIVLERPANKPFEPETLAWIESVVRFVGPVLALKRSEERSLWARCGHVLYRGLAAALGRTRLKLKLALLAVALSTGYLAMTDGPYRITAQASIEGSGRQLLVAPLNGYVETAQVRAGDLVSKGQLIAALDDQDLKLQLRRAESERNKIEKEYQAALANRDRTQLSILRAQLAQAKAEVQLVEEQIERTHLYAPFDGVILKGDLSQSLGSAVETGQLLFEVAPLDSYRVVLEVDEHDVAGLDAQRSGELVVTALPQSNFALSLEQITPVTISAEGRNFFRVEASLDEPSTQLRPGMQGVAKIDMGTRNQLWIWTHDVIDRIRLWAWSNGL